MRIYTKTGDKGNTSLLGGKKVLKSNYRIEAYGTIDELNSFLGLLRDHDVNKPYREILIKIQERLFTIGSILASDPGKSKVKIPALSEDDVHFLESSIDEMDEKLPEMRFFVLPGGHEAVSVCHIARTVCRRAERRVVELREKEQMPEILLVFLNRLSDFLFVLARSITQKVGAEEIPWKPSIE